MFCLALSSIIVDANVIVSALLKDSITRKALLGERMPAMLAPEFIKEELFKHSAEFAERLKVERKEVEESLRLLFEASGIMIVPATEYSTLLAKALKIIPDTKDAPYIALALKLDCPLWSNDSALKKQSVIKVYSTAELLQKLK